MVIFIGKSSSIFVSANVTITPWEMAWEQGGRKGGVGGVGFCVGRRRGDDTQGNKWQPDEARLAMEATSGDRSPPA
jgi:hypothetical protein